MMATDNPLGLEPSELAASKRAKEAAAARVSKLDQFKMQNAADTAAANAATAAANDPSATDIGLSDLGTEDPYTSAVTLSGVNEADTAEQAGKTAALNAGGSPAIFGDTAGLTQSKVNTITPPADHSASQSAYDALYTEFSKYGLGSMVEAVKGLIEQDASGPTLTLALMNTDAYKKRFSANDSRIANGLAALTPAAYIGLENQYQNLMRQYGLPASYYAKDSSGKNTGFDTLIGSDVSNVELEDRLATAQNRVLNANPDVLKTLKQFYPDINNGDILSYALDPKTAINALKAKVTGAEIGAAAYGAGLNQGTTPEAVAQYAANANLLQQQGVTGAQAQQGMGTVAQYAQRGSQLADIYNQQPYGQNQAQQEVFNLAGQTTATNQRKKLSALEQAQFSGQSGTASNVFSKDRAMSPMMLGVPGAGSY